MRNKIADIFLKGILVLVVETLVILFSFIFYWANLNKKTIKKEDRRNMKIEP